MAKCAGGGTKMTRRVSIKPLLFIVAVLTSCAAFAQHSVQLSWQDTINPTGSVTYSVYRGGGACSTMVSIKTGIATLAYADAGLSSGHYCYYVTAVDRNDTSLESKPSNTADAAVVPSPPVLNPPVQPAIGSGNE